MEKRTPKSEDIISVIISAYNAEKTLANTLESLENQSIDKNLYEVIISDDGSTTPGTREITERFVQKGAMNLLYLFAENKGVGIARNRGISESVGNILAFTDADCICDSDWLSTIYKNIRVDKKSFIGGYTYSNDTVIFPWKMAPVGQTGITANLAIDFSLIEAPLFDSGFTGMLGDDTDFVLRMEDNGVVLQSVPEMRVLHPPNIIGLRRIVIRARGRLNEIGLYKKHGNRVLSSFSPIFRPSICSRVSPFSVFVLVGMVGLGILFINYGFMGILAFTLLFIALFELYLYRFLVIYNPDNRDISLRDRTKTLLYFLVITPLFFYYRVQGMIRFRFFML